jgi:hypothetical protein
MTRILLRFKSVDLLEQVPLPTFDYSDNELPTAQADKPEKSRTKKRKDRRVGKGRKPAENSADASSPLINDNGNEKRKATLGLSASGCKRKKNGNDKAASKTHSKTHNVKSEAPTTTPTTTPPQPTKPQESDEGGRVIPFTRPPGAVEISVSGMTYGRRVYTALGYHAPIGSSEAAREIASFASKHDRIIEQLSGLPPPMTDGILTRGIAEAARIAKRRGSRKKGAIWHTVMDKIAAARLTEAM